MLKKLNQLFFFGKKVLCPFLCVLTVSMLSLTLFESFYGIISSVLINAVVPRGALQASGKPVGQR